MSLLLITSLTACGKTSSETNPSVENSIETKENVTQSEQTANEVDDASDNSFSTELDLSSNTVEPLNKEDKEESPFAMYNGYYSYSDENYMSCNISMVDGLVTIETRGESADGTQTEMYIEDNKALVELDGKLIQLGRKTEYDLEYTVVGSHVPSYMTAIPEEYVEGFVYSMQKILENSQREADRAKEELEEQKRYDEEQKALEEKEAADAAQKAEEEKKAAEAKEAKLAEKRKSSGWIKGKMVAFASGGSEHSISIEILDSNDFAVGSIIDIYCMEFDDCYNDFGFLFDNGYDSGKVFEAIVSPHACGASSSYRIMEQID